MGSTAWSDLEHEALLGLPMLARVLYLQGLRRYMDYATGIVGRSRGISYQSLAEVLYVEPVQGRHSSGAPTQKAIRSAIECLERAGLVQRIGAERKLVFSCPLAERGALARNMRGRRGADEGQTMRGTPGPSSSGPEDDMRGRTGADLTGPMRGTPPVSGIRDCTKPPSRDIGIGAERPPRAQRLTLTDLPEAWRTWCAAERPDLDPEATWRAFRDYWTTPGTRDATKVESFAAWMRWVRREYRTPDARRAGSKQRRVEAVAEEILHRYGCGHTYEHEHEGDEQRPGKGQAVG